MNKLGLKPLRRDRRDYSYHRTFGAAPLADLPSEYLLLSTILDQDGLAECTAYSACSVKESEFGVKFDTQWFFDKEGAENGSVSLEGYDLRIEASVGKKIGAKPIGAIGDESALPYRDLGYYWLHGPYDVFDSIRAAIWKEKRPIVAGLMWNTEYTDAKGGFIGQVGKTPLGLHAVKIAGWKNISGVPCIVIQNSFGPRGDGGLYYLPREAANAIFDQGIFMWTANPLDPLDVRTISLLQDFIGQLKSLVARLLALISKKK